MVRDCTRGTWKFLTTRFPGCFYNWWTTMCTFTFARNDHANSSLAPRPQTCYSETCFTLWQFGLSSCERSTIFQPRTMPAKSAKVTPFFCATVKSHSVYQASTELFIFPRNFLIWKIGRSCVNKSLLFKASCLHDPVVTYAADNLNVIPRYARELFSSLLKKIIIINKFYFEFRKWDVF